MTMTIHRRLFFAFSCIVILTVLANTCVIAYFSIHKVRERQSWNLHRVMETLSEANYPLTSSVLRQMRGLCGAEFVLLDQEGAIEHATLQFDDSTRKEMLRLRENHLTGEIPRKDAIRIEDRPYSLRWVDISPLSGRPQAKLLCVLSRKKEWWALLLEVASPILLSGVAVLPIAIGISAILSRKLVRPIRAIRRQAETLAEGSFEPIPLPERRDEIHDLAQSINQMALRLKAHDEKVRHQERFAILTRLGAGLAHQLRNHATGARMALQISRQQTDISSEREAIDQALHQLEMMETHLQRFLSLGKSNGDTPRQVNIADLIQEVVAMVAPSCRHQNILLATQIPKEKIFLLARAEALRQVILNLVMNAMDAVAVTSTEAREILIALHRDEQRRRITLEVCDGGPGPAEEIAGNMFELFVTSKPEGTGIGLSMAQQIVQAHGGILRWKRREGRTCFYVHIPDPDMESEIVAHSR